MRKCDVRTAEQALAYITDCNLATVATMASKKSKPKHEYDRQINIAQTAVTWMLEMNINIKGTRVEDVGTDLNSVRIWAQQFEPKDRSK